MFRSFCDTDRSYGLRSRVGHGSTGSSPSGSPCLPVPLPRYGKWVPGSPTTSTIGLSWPNPESSCAITGTWCFGTSASGGFGSTEKRASSLAPISVEPPCVAPGWDAADLSGLPPAVVETITQGRAPSTRQTYALKWSLFANWCSSRREDP